jgi:glycogen debranching enzyme
MTSEDFGESSGPDGVPWRRLSGEVRALIRRHVRQGYSGLLGKDYCYIAPAPRQYPFQWYWDSCFHALILSRLGEFPMAERILRSLFSMQRENGFLGHMIYWTQAVPKHLSDVLQSKPGLDELRPHMSALIQPPLAAYVVRRLFEATGNRVVMGELYAPIRRHLDWLAAHRDFDGDGLLSIISPFESGMDWKPSFDPILGYDARVTGKHLYSSPLYWRVMGVDGYNFAHRYDLDEIRAGGRFLVKEAGFNTLYAMDLKAAAELAELAGDDPAPLRARRRRVVESMLRLMYDERDAAFYDVGRPGDTKSKILTPTVFFPLALEEVDAGVAERILRAHFDNEREFASPFPLPSVALDDPSFYAGETPFIWRGPMWSFNNWFLYRALSGRGDAARAERLRDSLWRAVEKSGFREYYDPFTGKGHGAKNFTWPGLLLDMR